MTGSLGSGVIWASLPHPHFPAEPPSKYSFALEVPASAITDLSSYLGTFLYCAHRKETSCPSRRYLFYLNIRRILGTEKERRKSQYLWEIEVVGYLPESQELCLRVTAELLSKIPRIPDQNPVFCNLTQQRARTAL